MSNEPTGLTDEQIAEAARGITCDESAPWRFKFARRIEAIVTETVTRNLDRIHAENIEVLKRDLANARRDERERLLRECDGDP